MYERCGVSSDGMQHVAAGGTSVIVKDSIPHKVISLITPLQAVCSPLSPGEIVFQFVVLYLPPNSAVNRNDLEDLIAQLPTPLLILGDFKRAKPHVG